MSGICAKCQQRYFPLLSEREAAPHPRRIPWGVADEAYAAYAARHGTGQSLERIAERGGFAPCEMDELLPGWRMKARVEELLRRQLSQANELVGELERASRVRPGYELRCDECGAPHWFDTSLPSEIWNKIADPGEMLCLLCIEARLAAAGIHAEAEFYYAGEFLKSALYPEVTPPAAGGGSEGGGE